MNENNDPDSPLSPAQPAEEIPDWVKAQMPQEEPLPSAPEADPDQPKAVTLAEKHKARRQTSRRLLFQAGVSKPVISGSLQSSAAPEPPVEAQDPQQPPSSQENAGDLDVSEREADPTVSPPLVGVPTVSLPLVGVRTQPAGPVPLQDAEGVGDDVSAQAAGGPSVAAPPEDAFLQKARAYAQLAWPRMRPYLWRGRVAPAFWTVASVFSLVVNIILVVALILLGRQLFFLKKTVVSEKLINGLYYNFVLMDKAHIQTTITVSDTIQVKDTIPVVFDLVLSQKTVVTLTESTPIKGATIYLNGQPVPLDLVLPQGTKLGIQMNLTVPVKQSVPVVLNVPVNLQIPVDIPLDRTQLHQPFVGLQQVLSPFRQLLSDVPDSWSEVCKESLKPFCVLLRFK